MSAPTRFAVVGCGRMGRRRAATAAAHPEAAVACVVDVDAAKARALAAEFSVPAYASVEEALARESFDAVFVCTPPKGHAPAAFAALRARKHVFCEKPLARDPAEARSVVEAAESAGVTVKTGANLRWFPSVRKAKELLDASAVGKILFLRGWVGDAGGYFDGSWFADREQAGGGSFLDSGAHILDLTRWLVGEARSCMGRIATRHWDIPVEDNGFALYELEGGALASVQASWTEWRGYAYLEIYGSEGSLVVDNRGQASRTTLQPRQGTETVFDFSGLPPSSYADEFADYLSALRSGRAPTPSGRDGLRAVEMAHAAYESSAGGRSVDLTKARKP